jgi:Putative threonine/serine exporter
MSANDVVVTMLGITDAYGLRVHLDVTYTSISASHYPDRIQKAPHRYPQSVAMIGNAGVSAGAAMLFTTSWKIIMATFLTGLIVDRMLAPMEHWRVRPFFQQFAGAGVITLVAAGIAEAAAQGVSFLVDVDPTLVVVGGIVMLVAGMAIVGAAQDTIDQFYDPASPCTTVYCWWLERPRRQPIHVRVGQLCCSHSVSLWASRLAPLSGPISDGRSRTSFAAYLHAPVDGGAGRGD